MPTVTTILTLAPGASYLAANAVAKGTLFPNNKINPILPQQIYAVYFILKKIYDIDPNYDGLVPCSNYLWELMGKWGLAAQGLSGSGGNVPSPTPSSQGYPIYITQANFTTATFYPNANIFGTNIIIYLNELNRYLIPGIEFSVSSTGITIINTPGGQYLDGFDALTNTYNLVIERYYS